MSDKQPPTPPPQNEPDGMLPLPETMITAQEHPEFRLYGDESMMQTTDEHEQLTEDDLPTICLGCGYPVTMCICE